MIRAPKVRLVDENGEQIGIKDTDEAREYAWDKNLDLVEVAAQADPPVARVMDYGKYRYEQEQKAKLARKHQVSINVKEIKFRPKIGIHDYNTKKGHVERFLNQRAKVKVTIMFRGREQTHPERGRDLLMRLAEDVKEIGQVESPPLLDGLDPELASVLVDQPHPRCPDRFVDPVLRLRANGLDPAPWSQMLFTKFSSILSSDDKTAASSGPDPRLDDSV